MKTLRPTTPIVWILCLYLAAAGLLPAGFECADASCEEPEWLVECSLPDFGAPELTPGCGCAEAEAEPCRFRQANASPAALRLTQIRSEKNTPVGPPAAVAAAVQAFPAPLARVGTAQQVALGTQESTPLFLQHRALLC